MALFLDDDIYDLWFDDFFKGIHQHLKNNGMALIEGHENHLDPLLIMAQKYEFKNVSIIKDYTQRNRFLKIIK